MILPIILPISLILGGIVGAPLLEDLLVGGVTLGKQLRFLICRVGAQSVAVSLALFVQDRVDEVDPFLQVLLLIVTRDSITFTFKVLRVTYHPSSSHGLLLAGLLSHRGLSG
jgi:hypothetical protein